MHWRWTENNELISPEGVVIRLRCGDVRRIRAGDLRIRVSGDIGSSYGIETRISEQPLLQLSYDPWQGLRGTLAGYGEVFGHYGRYWSRSCDLLAISTERNRPGFRIVELEKDLALPPAAIAGFALEFMAAERIGLFESAEKDYSIS